MKITFEDDTKVELTKMDLEHFEDATKRDLREFGSIHVDGIKIVVEVSVFKSRRVRVWFHDTTTNVHYIFKLEITVGSHDRTTVTKGIIKNWRR
jgi:hypothetical protein